jgi:uncharacterized protein (TIGR02265 family)
LDDQPSLRRRRLRVKPTDQTAGFIFRGILDLVRKEAGELWQTRLREACGLPALIIPVLRYPSSQLLELIDRSVDCLREVRPRDDGTLLETIGAHTIDPFLQSTLGRLVFHLGTGPLEALALVPPAYRATHTFGDLELQKTDARAARLVARDVHLGPAYIATIPRLGLKAVCRLDADVHLEAVASDGSDFTLLVRW